jgi:nucleoside-diphosphate-sugar epimerase
MAAGMWGAEVVLHCAGLHAGKGDAQTMHRVNVLGTRRALAAAQESGVRRFVHVSTESVLAGPAGIRRVDETAPRSRRALGAYSRTKGEAEDIVLSATSPRLETVVVRPRLIWGGEGSTVMEGLVEAVSSGAFTWIGGGRYLTSTCHVLNACAGLMAAAKHGRSGEVYFVTDGEPVEFRWLVTELLASQGIEAPTREVPHWLAGLPRAVLNWPGTCCAGQGSRPCRASSSASSARSARSVTTRRGAKSATSRWSRPRRVCGTCAGPPAPRPPCRRRAAVNAKDLREN